MEFEKSITIDKEVYTLFDIQRGGSAIYKNNSTYLRIGSKEKIDRDLELHKRMEKFGFPVAKLLGEGQYDQLYYFIEESLGEHHFGEIFKKETADAGIVSDNSFQQFLNMCVDFAKAQLKTIETNKNFEVFRKGIHLDIMLEELPEEKEKIFQKYLQSEQNLKDFPFGIEHGDFTPFNIYPKGIIDLEDSFMGPVGYDLGTIMEIQNWFPEHSDDEFHRVYKLTPEQKTQFYKTIDEIYLNKGLPKISNFKTDFDFIKGIWFTVRMQALPKLQKFRYDLIKRMVG